MTYPGIICVIVGYLTQAEGYYNHSRCSNMPGETVYCGYDLWDNDKIDTSKIGQYSTHLFTEKSIDIINNHDNDQVSSTLPLYHVHSLPLPHCTFVLLLYLKIS